LLVCVQMRVISCATDEEARRDEIHSTFFCGDDGLASLTLDSIRSSQNILFRATA
jgi:hypothetical protein